MDLFLLIVFFIYYLLLLPFVFKSSNHKTRKILIVIGLAGIVLICLMWLCILILNMFYHPYREDIEVINLLFGHSGLLLFCLISIGLIIDPSKLWIRTITVVALLLVFLSSILGFADTFNSINLTQDQLIHWVRYAVVLSVEELFDLSPRVVYAYLTIFSVLTLLLVIYPNKTITRLFVAIGLIILVGYFLIGLPVHLYTFFQTHITNINYFIMVVMFFIFYFFFCLLIVTLLPVSVLLLPNARLSCWLQTKFGQSGILGCFLIGYGMAFMVIETIYSSNTLMLGP